MAATTQTNSPTLLRVPVLSQPQHSNPPLPFLQPTRATLYAAVNRLTAWPTLLLSPLSVHTLPGRARFGCANIVNPVVLNCHRQAHQQYSLQFDRYETFSLNPSVSF